MNAGERIPRRPISDADAERSPTAILRFRHSAAGSGISRRGPIRPGGRLVVEYDPARLAPSAKHSGAAWDVVCHVRFDPGEQHHSSSVLDRPTAGAQGGTPRQVPLELPVPADVTHVELWFESRGPDGTMGWDSRYGQNYSFPVMGEGLPVPEPSVVLRPDALIDPSKIRVVEDAATKETRFVGASGRLLHTGLVIRALVGDANGTIDAWADIHLFDAANELIHTGSVVLERRESQANGTLFVWEDDIYQGSGGGSGIGVWSRPNAQTVQYRLYCRAQRPVFEMQAQVFTDGVLHEFEVPADEDVADGA